MSGRHLARTLLGWSLVLALAWCARTPSAPESDPGRPGSATQSACAPLGPLSGLGSALAWLRADRAWRSGSIELAFARAESALALDPGASSGWTLLAHWHLVLASPAVEPDPARRGAWLAASLGVLDRGQELAREPADLEFAAGIALLTQGSFDEPPDWPGGPEALLEEAQRRFERAAELGHPMALEMAHELPHEHPED